MSYAPRSGRIIGADGQIYNLVDLLGGGIPVSDATYNINQYAPQGGLVIGEDGKLYSLIELLQNVGTGGGGNITWANLIGKPSVFPPEEHNHDTRYYTQEQIDAPGFLASRVDNQTIYVQGRELKAKSLDGLSYDGTELDDLTRGAEGNYQVQIDALKLLVNSMASGMRWRGIFETKTDLEAVINKKGGDQAVVLSDETRGGARNIYIYNDGLGIWQYVIEVMELTLSLLSMTDTPNSFVGQNGKILKVDEINNRVIFNKLQWDEIDGKPDRTKAQIEGAVDNAHGHDNKRKLDKINEDASGILMYNGERYVRVSDLPAMQAKKRLFAYRSGSDQPLTAGTDCVFNTKHSGDIPYNTTTGIFTLEAGKLYRVEVVGSLYTSGWVILQLVNAETNSIVNTIARGIWMDVNPSTTSWHESSAGPLKAYFIPSATRGYKIRATAVSGESSLRSNYMSLEVQEI